VPNAGNQEISHDSILPAGNGQVENANKTVKSLLMAKVESEPETWDQHLGPCLMANKSSEHYSAGYTPYSLMFGIEVRLPLDVMMGDLVTNTDNHGDYVSGLKNHLSNAFRDVRGQLKKAQHRQKEYFDKVVETFQYAPGDLVFVLMFNPQVKTGETAKFHRKLKGPYEVLERRNEVNYRIRKPSDPKSRSKVVDFNNLKLYQRKQGESTRGQEKDSDGCGTVAMDSRTDGEESDELPADLFSFPENSMVSSPEDTNSEAPVKKTTPEGTTLQAQIEETTPEDATSQAQIGLEARHGGFDVTLVPTEDAGQVQEKAVGSSVATECDESSGSDTTRTTSPIDDRSRPNRMTRSPDRYGEWELNAVMSSDLPPILLSEGSSRHIRIEYSASKKIVCGKLPTKRAKGSGGKKKDSVERKLN